MKVSVILAVVSMMVAVDMSYGDCLQAIKDGCTDVAKLGAENAQTNEQYCRVKDIYLTCAQSCDDIATLTALVDKMLADAGIECGTSTVSSTDTGTESSSGSVSAMVTFSSSMLMLMLMLFTTLQIFF